MAAVRDCNDIQKIPNRRTDRKKKSAEGEITKWNNRRREREKKFSNSKKKKEMDQIDTF